MNLNSKLASVLCIYLIGICASPIIAETSKPVFPNRIIQLTNVPLNGEEAKRFQFDEKSYPNLPSKTKISNDSFGLWIEAEGQSQPLNNPAELNKLLKLLKDYPISDVYIQVYRNGKSWFPSKYADESPYQKILHYGFDPLKKIIEVAKSKPNPIKVHVWFNSLRLGSDKNTKVLKYLGNDAVLVSTRGESLAESSGYGRYGCRPDTPGIWLDPNNKRVATLLLNLFLEVYSTYPQIDGLHLDMIRNPFPYSASGERVDPNCSGFIAKYDQEKLLAARAGLRNTNIEDNELSKLNEKGPTVVVRKIRKVMKALFPKVELSAAVLSNQQKATKHANQNWPKWIEDDLIDRVVTMNYTTDFDRFKKESQDAFNVSQNKISIGLGAWLALKHTPTLLNQIRYLQSNGKKKYVLYSYGNLSNQNGDKIYNQIMTLHNE
jgi:uncharacterized lipoprotein YddW (UPF0748 family)